MIIVSDDLKDESLATGCEVHLLQRPPTHWHPKYLWQLLKIIRKIKYKSFIPIILGARCGLYLCKLVFPNLELGIYDS